MDLQRSIAISAAGLKAQSLRMRVVAENLANKDSLATAPGEQPYQRKVVLFKDVLDREIGARTVKVDRVTTDNSDYEKIYMPSHPGADAQGYVLKPNVNGIIEASDMKEAQRSYEANLNAVEAAKSLTMRTIDLLR